MSNTEPAAPPLEVVGPLQSEDYFSILGLGLTPPEEGSDYDWPDYDQMKRAWREQVAVQHPSKHPPGEAAYQEQRFRAVMEAFSCLTDPEMGPKYREFIESAESGHADWMASEHRVPWAYDLPDEVALLVTDLIQDCEDAMPDDLDKLVEAASSVKAGHLPSVIAASRLMGVEDCDLTGIIAETLEQFQTAECLNDVRAFVRRYPHALSWVWSRKPFRDGGIAGTVMRPLALNERERAHRAGSDNTKPFAEIRVALTWWLMAPHEQRVRHLFRALSRYFEESGRLKVAAVRSATTADEIQHFGLDNADDAHFVAEALRHPKTAEVMAKYEVLPDGQLTLFGGYHKQAVKLDH